MNTVSMRQLQVEVMSTGGGGRGGGGLMKKVGDNCRKNDKHTRKKMKAERKRFILRKEVNTGEGDEYKRREM
jgi:hypothetical protein